VLSRNLVNEEAVAHWGVVAPKKKARKKKERKCDVNMLFW